MILNRHKQRVAPATGHTVVLMADGRYLLRWVRVVDGAERMTRRICGVDAARDFCARWGCPMPATRGAP